jgi:NAD(P)-dependent dehydrogenase (short-subunit alcohol dehydrogenase family)
MGGKIYTPFGGWYHAAEHALEGFSDCLRLETEPFGIDVIIVEPGGIATDWGLIAADNLKKTSGGGAYGEVAARAADAMHRRYAGAQLSDPSVIAKAILRAVSS